MGLTPVADALAHILDGAHPAGAADLVPVGEAAGRILAAPLSALRTQPPFDASAMDGYAVRALDANAGAILTVVGESAAGHGFSGQVGAGEAVRIFTGAPVPPGADAIVIQEQTERLDGGQIRLSESALSGRHIRRAGVDFTEGGDAVLQAGRLLDTGAITLAAAMNHAHIPVVRRPRVAVLATGDELRLPGSALGPSEIIASNTYGVMALIRAAGGETIDLGIAADRMDALDAALDSVFANRADVLVTIGGASVGDHDLVQKVLSSRGMQLDFWKIAMRPGKPLMSGRLGDMRILGLPGNPASSLVCAFLFLEPLVAALGGRPAPNRHQTAFLSKDLPENDQRQDYLRATLFRHEDGSLIATPFSAQDSSLMRVFAQADCLIIRPPFAPAAKTGDETGILLLRG